MVQLKGSNNFHSLGMQKFQFLDGTIKRSSEKSQIKTAYLFQFLDGTIKRPSVGKTALAINNFNSLMVQLKATANISIGNV